MGVPLDYNKFYPQIQPTTQPMDHKPIFASRQDNPFSNQSSRKQMSNSVKTPALLFYKPNSNPSTGKKPKTEHENPQIHELACENHAQVVARYYSKTDDQEEIYYCDKCAHLLKEQGFSIFPISGYGQGVTRQKTGILKIGQRNHMNYPFPQRQKQINDFLSSLDQARGELDDNSSQARQILISSQQFYGQQIQEINDYFQSIIQSLELQKNKCYNHILQQRQNAERETRNLMKKLNEGEKEINSMMADIEENLDSVYSISWQNYKLVMDTFEGRLSDITRLLGEIREKGVADVEYRKIEFAGVPESINSLSQIIIQNSYGSAHYTDGSLLLTQGSNQSLKRGHQLQELSSNGQQSIFQKLRTDHSHSEDDGRNVSHLMFSFDGERMRELESQAKFCKENQSHGGNYFGGQEADVKIKRNRGYGYGEPVQKVAGIKQVEQLDVLVMDDDHFNH